LPFQDLHTNAAWVELALTAADLTTWAQALCFTCAQRKLEPKRLRNRRPHVTCRLVRTGLRLSCALDQNCPGPPAWPPPSNRLGAAPWPG